MRQQKTWIALLALLFIFAACKGESPTAPPPSGGPGPTPTPTGVTLTLTASNATPVVDSVVTITAVVTVNGAPAPDGTAVEFQANGGSFSATETITSILRTTVNGIATVQLRSTVAGAIRVLAAVSNVTRTVDVTFRVGDVTTPPPNTTPSITGVTPSLGPPTGGQRIVITGTNFREPVRVLFDTGAALPVEAFVTARTETSIEVLTPSVNLGAGQQLLADVIVITQAGSATEQRAELEDGFTFRNEQLTPRVSTASPISGPVTGGTRVTIFGDGFQFPVQVLFGAAEARIISVDFNQIIVESPAARDTSDNGSGTVTGPVTITVRNINSQTATTLDAGFHYVAAIDITSFRPLNGPATGGTEVVIDGIGFVSGADVTIAGVRAIVLQVTGTRILARTTALSSGCAGASGPVRVTNVVNGNFEEFTEELFTYVPVLPLITSVTSAVPGDDITVVVRDPGVGALGSADIRFSLNSRTLIPSPDRITNGTGVQPFNVVLPLTGFTFPQEACTTTIGGLAGTRSGPLELPLTFNNLSTGCSTTTTVTVLPPVPNPCLAPPQPTVTAPAGGSCATPGPASVTGVGFPSTTTASIVISNGSESQPLNITSVAISGSNASEFRISPTSASNIAAGGNANFTLTFDPTSAGAKDAVVTFTTNSTSNPTLTVCVQATAAP